MCRKHLVFAVLTAMVAYFSGCAQSGVKDDNEANGKVTVTASIASAWRSAETKVGLEDKGTQGIELTWRAGDAIAMYDSAGRLAATFELAPESDGLQSGNFTLADGSVYGGERYTVIFPADESRTLAGRRRIADLISQSGNVNADHLRDICYMRADYMHSAGGIVSFELEFAMLTVTIAPPADYLSGNYGTPRSLTVINGANHNTALIDGVEDLRSPITVYMLIEPTAAEDRTIIFHLICSNEYGNHLFSRKIENIDKVYEAGKRYTADLSGENELVFVEGRLLADFSAANRPEGDIWVVSDVLNVSDPAAEMYGLRDALRQVYSADNNRRINLVIPNAIGIPGIAAEDNIENAALYGCDALLSVSMPFATQIGSAAFAYCNNIKTINLPNARMIQASAFTFCNSIESVSLQSAAEIRENAFQNCRNLSSVNLPEAVMINYFAFLDCPSLASISLPAAATIGNGAFYYCVNLSSASLPAATYIGNNVFYNCSRLTSASLPAAISIGNSAFAGCLALSEVEIATSSVGLYSTPENLFANANPEANITLTIGATESRIQGVGTDVGNDIWRNYGPFANVIVADAN